MIPSEWQLRVPEGVDDPTSRAFVTLLEERLGAVPVERVLVWHTDTVVESALAHLAELLDIDMLAHGVEETRVLLEQAIERLRRRGTASAVEETLHALGLEGAFVQERTVLRHDGAVNHDGTHLHGAEAYWALFWVFVPEWPEVDLETMVRAIEKTKRRTSQLAAIFAVSDIGNPFATVVRWYRAGSEHYSFAREGGLVLDFDMLDPEARELDGAEIASFVNKASGVVVPQATSAARATLELEGMGGKPCARFDGVDDYYRWAEAPAVAALSGGHDFTAFAVARFDTPVRRDIILACSVAALETSRRMLGKEGASPSGRIDQVMVNDADEGPEWLPASTVHDDGGAHVFMWRQRTNAGALRVDNAPGNPASAHLDTGPLTPTRVGLGAWPFDAPNTFALERISQVLLYDRALGRAAQTRVIRALQRRWGLEVRPPTFAHDAELAPVVVDAVIGEMVAELSDGAPGGTIDVAMDPVMVNVSVSGLSADVWLPPDLSGLVAWFDMQDAASFTNTSGAVSAIVNKASGVTWSQATAGARPAYSATKLNGFPCLDCDGSNDIIISNEAPVVAAMTNSPALTVFGVVQSDNADLSVYWFSAGSTAVAGLPRSRGFGTNTDGTGSYLAGASNDASQAKNLISSASSGDTSPHAFEYFTDGATGSIVIDGGTANPNNAAQAIGTLTPTQCGIGGAARQTPAVCFNGAVGEILVFSRQLNATERGKVRRYLGAKWGIAVS